jgi:hypothetical protein
MFRRKPAPDLGGDRRVGKGGPELSLMHRFRPAVPTRSAARLRVGTASESSPDNRHFGRLCPPDGLCTKRNELPRTPDPRHHGPGRRITRREAFLEALVHIGYERFIRKRSGLLRPSRSVHGRRSGTRKLARTRHVYLPDLLGLCGKSGWSSPAASRSHTDLMTVIDADQPNPTKSRLFSAMIQPC